AAQSARVSSVLSHSVAGYDEEGGIVIYLSEQPTDELQEKLKNALGSPFASLAAPRIRIAEALSALDLGKLTVRETGLLERLGARPPEAPLHTAPETGFASDAPFH